MGFRLTLLLAAAVFGCGWWLSDQFRLVGMSDADLTREGMRVADALPGMRDARALIRAAREAEAGEQPSVPVAVAAAQHGSHAVPLDACRCGVVEGRGP